MFLRFDYQLLLQFLLAAIATSSCTLTDTDPIGNSPISTPSPITTEPNPFNSVLFPQDSCGDSLPKDSSAYPVNFYPVFVEYSEKNLQILQSQFCKDSIEVFRDNKNKTFIQVASFTSQDKAEQFRKFIFQKIGMGELGESTTLIYTPSPKYVATDKNIDSKVASLALLTKDQAVSLIRIDDDFQIIVPTYIPKEFKLYQFKIENDPHKKYNLRQYHLIYKNLRNQCFSIIGLGFKTGGGGDSSKLLRVKVQSPIFGETELLYTELDSDREFIGTDDMVFIKDDSLPGGRNFSSAYIFESRNEIQHNCKTASLQEMVKVFESLQYLNP